MTDDERRNRNPAPEAMVVKLADCPEIHVADLEPRHVYILENERYAASLNFLGTFHVQDPATLDSILVYRFFAPRLLSFVDYKPGPDGTLLSGETGKKVTLRKYTGPDA